MTATPEQADRMRRIGSASIEIIESMRAITAAHGLSTQEAIDAMRLASESTEAAVNVLEIMAGLMKEEPHG